MAAQTTCPRPTRSYKLACQKIEGMLGQVVQDHLGSMTWVSRGGGGRLALARVLYVAMQRRLRGVWEAKVFWAWYLSAACCRRSAPR
jgi:hypothetical protein